MVGKAMRRLNALAAAAQPVGVLEAGAEVRLRCSAPALLADFGVMLLSCPVRWRICGGALCVRLPHRSEKE
jgi:hypothetical protein